MAPQPASCPSGHALLGHLPAFMKDPLGFLTHCARHYGLVVPLRFLHRRAFLLLDAADIECVLVTEPHRFAKPLWLRTPAVQRLLGDGLVSSDGETWHCRRQISRPAFHSLCMEGYGAKISVLAERMLEGWQEGQVRELQREMTHLTLEVVARTLFDVDMPGWVEDAGAAIDTLMARFTARGSLFGMLPLPPTPAEIRAARQLDRIMERLIQWHDAAKGPGSRDAPKGGESLISLMERAAEQGEACMSGRSLQDQLKTLLAAGYESSALVLCWAFLLLARHPEAEARLAAELETVLGGRPPLPADLPRLPYCRAVVQETLRLYPPLWMTGREAISPCEIGGFRVPAGALVMTSQWAVQRHPRYFPQPDAFRPERWEGAETTDLPRFAYFPFGGGPRVCIGQKFAQMEAVLLLAAIARRFRLEPDTEQEISPWVTMTLRPPAGVRVRLKGRVPPPPAPPPCMGEGSFYTQV
ncbi:MAG TPA: cytochrome P450 [Chthonomonadaceae bacterium]|nr:cytochrome P450 [Chthonomonadaceae bacterium]